jgi:hypothetical protein
MLVKAALGLKVPKEAKPREYITDAKAVEVPESVYYRRCLAQGDLVLAEQPVKKAGAKPTAEE